MLWHGYRAGELNRAQLQAEMQSLQTAFHAWLERGKDVPYEKARAFSRELLSLETALWTFVREEGVEPTNNAAERVLRPAVVWRKLCCPAGTRSQSEAGAHYVERMLTVIAASKQQNRHLLTVLIDAVEAYWARTLPPILTQGA
ncbi:MAG: hypothetical protein KatS3mg057_0928 [Herpetosiphonaceae bacterium]|nr:MAG: hypothetical protein KatS3mg057_0928 [Herpetosiphonaceae bacterium]